jgi:hypothetical protein
MCRRGYIAAVSPGKASYKASFVPLHLLLLLLYSNSHNSYISCVSLPKDPLHTALPPKATSISSFIPASYLTTKSHNAGPSCYCPARGCPYHFPLLQSLDCLYNFYLHLPQLPHFYHHFFFRPPFSFFTTYRPSLRNTSRLYPPRRQRIRIYWPSARR